MNPCKLNIIRIFLIIKLIKYIKFHTIEISISQFLLRNFAKKIKKLWTCIFQLKKY